ncbi:MAG: putative transposase [Verrucomicrobiota bacterium]|jgi:putative transposase
MPHSYKFKPGCDAVYKRKPCVLIELREQCTALIEVNKQQKVVAIGELSPPKDAMPNERPKDLLSFCGAERSEANKRFHAIRRLLNRPRTEAEVEACAEKQKVDPATIYRWLKVFEGNGKLQSLVPGKSDGGKGGSRIDPKVEKIVTEKVDTFFLSQQRHSPTEVYEKIVETCNKVGVKPLCYNSLMLRLGALDPEIKAKARGGAKANDNSSMTGGSIRADLPHEIAQIDHTPLDCIALDDEQRPIGRPLLTLMIDVFSRMILGYFLSFAAPSTAVVGRCIVNAVLPKQRLLGRLGLSKFQWNCWGFPKVIHADNAKEFHTNVLDDAAREYVFDLVWRPLARPRWGAHIENLMGQVAKEMRKLEGATFSSLRERADYDSEGCALYTLEDLEKYIATWIVGKYANHPRQALDGRTPLQMQEYGYTKIGSPPAMIVDPKKLDLDFMPAFSRTVNWYGVQIDKIHYDDDILNRYRLVTDGTRKLKPHIFRRDPWSLRRIWFYEPSSREYHPVGYRDKNKEEGKHDLSIWELDEARKRLKAQNCANRDVTEAKIFEANEELRKLREEALGRSKRARRGKARSAIPKDSIASNEPDAEPATPPNSPDVDPDVEADDDDTTFKVEDA